MERNLKHRLLGNIPIPLKDICFIHSLTIKEILFDIDKYELMLSNLIIEIKDIVPDAKDTENIHTFDILIYNILQDKKGDYCKYILDAIKTFIKEDVSFVFTPSEDLDNIPNSAYFSIGNQEKPEECRFLGKKDYDEFKYILKKSNNINDKEVEEEYKPLNSRAQEILDKINKGKAKIAKRKGELHLTDIVSSIVAKNSLNLIDVMEYNIYQVYDILSRIQMIEEFETSINSLLAGCDPDKIDVKHYLRPRDR